ncbi:MAG TPA: LytR C-terminal domain-containing protein [Mycobacteriales bacterium]|nr:LytR C-terminal domain-containing protein [Mycobacteriales bacterium]
MPGRPSRLPPRPGARDPWWSPAGSAPGDALVEEVPTQEVRVPLTRHGRPARAARPPQLPVARALTGALVAVAGVALGIGTLLWATDAPETAGRGTLAAAPAAEPAAEPDAAPLDEPAVEEPAAEEPAAPAVEVPVEEPAEVPADVPAEQPAAEAPAPAAATVDEPAVLVLNNSRIAGLAERSARRFEAAGWPVRDTGSLRGRIRATTVYYPPGQRAAAEEFARRFPEVRRVLPRLEGLPGTGLTVVMTRDAA